MTSNFQQFEQYLNDYSYVSGYLLSTLDVDLCFALQKVHIDKNKLPNTYRWFNHVKNFKKNDCLIQGGGNNLPQSLSLWISSILNVREFFRLCKKLVGLHGGSCNTNFSCNNIHDRYSIFRKTQPTK
jgi:hypothetical protein